MLDANETTRTLKRNTNSFVMCISIHISRCNSNISNGGNGANAQQHLFRTVWVHWHSFSAMNLDLSEEAQVQLWHHWCSTAHTFKVTCTMSFRGEYGAVSVFTPFILHSHSPSLHVVATVCITLHSRLYVETFALPVLKCIYRACLFPLWLCYIPVRQLLMLLLHSVFVANEFYLLFRKHSAFNIQHPILFYVPSIYVELYQAAYEWNTYIDTDVTITHRWAD